MQLPTSRPHAHLPSLLHAEAELAVELEEVTKLGLRVCTVGDGEAIYIPPQWHHATLNLDTYNVFVSTFTQEHASLA